MKKTVARHIARPSRAVEHETCMVHAVCCHPVLARVRNQTSAYVSTCRST